MLVGVLFGDGNTHVTSHRAANVMPPMFRYGGRGAGLAGDEHLHGIGSFTKRMVRKTKNAVGDVATAPFKMTAKVTRTVSHGALNVGRNVGGSVFGTVRSVAPAAAQVATAYIATKSGGSPFGPAMDPNISTGIIPTSAPVTTEQVVNSNKMNSALLYGGAGVGALLLGGAILLIMKRK